jgi:hypothetical protein
MEAKARSCIPSWLQDLLEAEVTEFLGRGKSQRRAEWAQARLGYRNGYLLQLQRGLLAEQFALAPRYCTAAISRFELSQNGGNVVILNIASAWARLLRYSFSRP